MPNINQSLARRIKRDHQTLTIHNDGEFVFVYGDDSPDMLIKEINEIVYNHFDGVIKDVEFVVYDDCVVYRAIPETAIIIK